MGKDGSRTLDNEGGTTLPFLTAVERMSQRRAWGFSQTVLREVLNLIYPPHCLVCSQSIPGFADVLFCRSCYRKLPLVGAKRCQSCGRFLAGGDSFPARCRGCQTSQVFFDSGRSCLRFNPVTRKLLHALKYKFRFGLAPHFSAFMTHTLKQYPFKQDVDFLVPVPLHSKRIRVRGFNQSALLARSFSHKTGIPVVQALVRNRYEESQTRLRRKSRAQSVYQSFQMKEGVTLFDRHCLLMDDVLTTGATLNECARVLKQHGASRVSLFTFVSVSDDHTPRSKLIGEKRV